MRRSLDEGSIHAARTGRRAALAEVGVLALGALALVAPATVRADNSCGSDGDPTDPVGHGRRRTGAGDSDPHDPAGGCRTACSDDDPTDPAGRGARCGR
jgi:hypothetical protein